MIFDMKVKKIPIKTNPILKENIKCCECNKRARLYYRAKPYCQTHKPLEMIPSRQRQVILKQRKERAYKRLADELGTNGDYPYIKRTIKL